MPTDTLHTQLSRHSRCERYVLGLAIGFLAYEPQHRITKKWMHDAHEETHVPARRFIRVTMNASVRQKHSSQLKNTHAVSAITPLIAMGSNQYGVPSRPRAVCGSEFTAFLLQQHSLDVWYFLLSLEWTKRWMDAWVPLGWVCYERDVDKAIDACDRAGGSLEDVAENIADIASPAFRWRIFVRDTMTSAQTALDHHPPDAWALGSLWRHTLCRGELFLTIDQYRHVKRFHRHPDVYAVMLAIDDRAHLADARDGRSRAQSDARVGDPAPRTET